MVKIKHNHVYPPTGPPCSSVLFSLFFRFRHRSQKQKGEILHLFVLPLDKKKNRERECLIVNRLRQWMPLLVSLSVHTIFIPNSFVLLRFCPLNRQLIAFSMFNPIFSFAILLSILSPNTLSLLF